MQGGQRTTQFCNRGINCANKTNAIKINFTKSTKQRKSLTVFDFVFGFFNVEGFYSRDYIEDSTKAMASLDHTPLQKSKFLRPL